MLWRGNKSITIHIKNHSMQKAKSIGFTVKLLNKKLEFYLTPNQNKPIIVILPKYIII